LAGDAVLIAPVSKAKSLQTRNFTGNFTNSRTGRLPAMLETPARQPFLAEFATRNNRENLPKNRIGDFGLFDHFVGAAEQAIATLVV
jgi:hypothetical protein